MHRLMKQFLMLKEKFPDVNVVINRKNSKKDFPETSIVVWHALQATCVVLLNTDVRPTKRIFGCTLAATHFVSPAYLQ